MGYPISIQMSYVTIILIGTRIIKVGKKPRKVGHFHIWKSAKKTQWHWGRNFRSSNYELEGHVSCNKVASLVAMLFRAPETTRQKIWRASGFTCSVVTACLVFIFLFLVYPPADSSQTWIWDTCSVPYLLPNHAHVCLHRGRDCGLSEKEGLPALTDPNSGNFYTKKITNVARCSKVNFLL